LGALNRASFLKQIPNAFALPYFFRHTMLRFETAGESHGECLVATMSGLPAGIPVSLESVDRELWRRQQGYGRGGRMKIESDRARIVSGVRHGKTIGSPIALIIENKDWKNWTEALPVEDAEGADDRKKPVTRPRPGHADLAGVLKYNFTDARYILERASARETAARVAVGALAKAFLKEFGVEVLSHIIAIGSARVERSASWDEIVSLSRRDEVFLNCADPEAEQRMKAEIDVAYRTGDTIGGVFEVVAHDVPPGLGSHVTWDRKLDGRLAQAIVSMQAVKGVEIGFAAEGAASFGSKVQDTIHYDKSAHHFTRGANRAGGLEGGITNGQDILVRGMLKPISTLRKPLESVDLSTREPALAAYERSDVCVAPAAGVIGEAMVAIVLASAMLEKFGGDSLQEIRRNFDNYLQQVKNF
jgi:chorismate synthase